MSFLQTAGEVNSLCGEYKWEVDISGHVVQLFSKALFSPKFSFYINNKETLWRLVLDKQTARKNVCAVHLLNLTDFETDLNCQFFGTFVFKDKKISENLGKLVIKPCSITENKNYVSWTTEEHEIDKLKHFTILCTIKIKNDDKVNQISNQNKRAGVYESLFNDKRLCDVRVLAGEKKFFLHKCILVNRSIVFEKMFEADMVEKHKSTISIPDFDPEILYKFFKYLYTNEVDDLSVVASDLLRVANKYMVKELKSICEKSMCDTLNPNNAIEYIKLAEIYNAELLRSNAVKYIAKNMKSFKSLITSDDGSFFENLSPKLLADILNNIALS